MNFKYNAKYWIDKLKMQPHPEGGYYKETYRNKNQVEFPGYAGKRNIATSIYYLLENSDKSRLHRLKSDELWYYHYGASLNVVMINLDGELNEIILGPDIDKGEQLQITIPACTIFGAYIPDEGNFSLFGCMVNPGFDFEDFELMEKENLLRNNPKFKDIIDKLTK